jgi:hypothetical protein
MIELATPCASPPRARQWQIAWWMPTRALEITMPRSCARRQHGRAVVGIGRIGDHRRQAAREQLDAVQRQRLRGSVAQPRIEAFGAMC